MPLHQTFNLHSHTSRCGHASGTDEDYLLHARDAGFTELGFSDHVMLPGVSQIGIRANCDVLPEYVRSINELKDKYRDEMKIHVGFEAEWLGEEFAWYYRDLLTTGRISYLLLGQHCFHKGGALIWYATLPHGESIKRYTKDLIAGMDSGLFLYVCHPDTFLRWHGEFDDEARQACIDICLAAKRNNIPLEINLSVGRFAFDRLTKPGSLEYPCAMFWDIASVVGVTCVFGVDAHNPADYQTTPYDYYMQFAEDHHLKLLRESPLKDDKKL